jgi:hypothetical protein
MNLVFITDFEYISISSRRKKVSWSEFFSFLFPQLLRFSLMRKTDAKMNRVLYCAKKFSNLQEFNS